MSGVVQESPGLSSMELWSSDTVAEQWIATCSGCSATVQVEYPDEDTLEEGRDVDDDDDLPKESLEAKGATKGRTIIVLLEHWLVSGGGGGDN